MTGTPCAGLSDLENAHGSWTVRRQKRTAKMSTSQNNLPNNQSPINSEWVKENWELLISSEYIRNEDIPSEIKELACENVCPNFDGVVYGNSNGDCWGDTWSSNTYINPESGNIEIYRMSSNQFYDVSLEDVFGTEVRSVIDFALKNGLDPDYEYDAEEVVKHAQKHTLVNGNSWNEILVEYWSTDW